MTKKQAYSLIELSIVIVIIGILIAGILQGSGLVNKSRIAAAISLTKSSPVITTPNLTLWLETSLSYNEDTITSTTHNTKPEDGDFISAWKDINPQLKKKKILSQTTVDGRRPNYLEKGINGIPSLEFDTDSGNQDYLTLTQGSMPINISDNSYTMFVVWKSDRPSSDYSGASSVILAQGEAADYHEAGLAINSAVKFQYYGQNNTYTSASSEVDYMPGKTYILGVAINNNNASNVRFFTNGFMSQGTSTNKDEADIQMDSFMIGTQQTALTFAGGLFSEIIIFDRDLTNEEIKTINQYLARKYGVTLTN